MHKQYFIENNEYFWKTETDDAIGTNRLFVVVNGPTISYEAYVIELLELLALQGFPPFGSLLLAIVATNPNYEVALSCINENIILYENEDSAPFPMKISIAKAMNFLYNLSKLPDEYKTGNKRKMLFLTIFVNSHNQLSPAKSSELLSAFKEAIKSNKSVFSKRQFDWNIFKKDFRTIALLNARYPSVDEIIEAVENQPNIDIITTNIDEKIIEGAVKDAPPESFIDLLAKDPATFQIGSLIKRLWSGLQIPYYQNTPSGQPIGGVSDLSNKGDFSRLLLSEFANDEDLFISRIANNEALYIEREIPPNDDKIRRVFLIDSTIKNWGTSKILAHAISIAISLHPRSKMEYTYYILGEKAVLVDLDTVQHVLDSSNIVTCQLNAAMGLADYFLIEKKSTNTEVFLISHPDVFKSNEMQAVLQENSGSLHFLITASSEGEIDIYKYHQKTKKHVQRLALDLEKLWAKNSVAMQKSQNFAPTNLSIPLLYPLQKKYSHIMFSAGVYYTYLNRKIYQFAENDFTKGFKIIAENIDMENGRSVIYTVENDLTIAFLTHNNKIITYYNLSKNTRQSIELSNHAIISQRTELLVINNQLLLCGEKVWSIQNTYYKLEERLDSNTKEIADYFEKLNSFKQLYKKSKPKFSFGGTLYKIGFTKENIVVNNWELINEHFYDMHSLSQHFKKKYFPQSNLYLKKPGEYKLKIIQIIKDELGVDLQTAKKIVDDAPKILAENINEEKANDFKKLLEDNGAICYTKSTFVQFDNGAKISCMDNILIFESKQEKTPTFYIPFITDAQLAFATEHEFAGNPYFLSNENFLTQIPVDDFYCKYIIPFIESIQNDEAAD